MTDVANVRNLFRYFPATPGVTHFRGVLIGAVISLGVACLVGLSLLPIESFGEANGSLWMFVP